MIPEIPAGEYSLLVESRENQAYQYRSSITITSGKTVITGKEGYREGRSAVTVIPDQTSNITIRLTPIPPPGEPGNISGFVKDTAGNCLPGAKVMAIIAMTGISIEKPHVYEAITGDDGSFSIGLMPPGIYKLLFTKEEFHMASLPLEIMSGETSSVQVVLKPIMLITGSIVGTVTNSADNPVSDVVITVEITTSCAQLSIVDCIHPIFQTLSDGNGSFELENLSALEGYVLTAQKTGHEKVVKTSVNVTAGGVTRADFTLHALDSGVELILRDTDGKPLPGMMAKVSGPEIELYQLTDQSGKVVFYLKPGEYILTSPIENYYRIMGDVVMGEGGTIAGSSLSMPICYPDYAKCLNFEQTFISHSEKVNVNQGEIIKNTFMIKSFLLSPVEGAVTNDPMPTFLWNPYPNAASYTIRVHDNVTLQIMWQAKLAETTAVYNYDGTGGLLLPGGRYSWQITTDTGVQSNRHSFTTTAADTTGPIVP